MLAACAVHTARQFARAIIMPNLVPPVTKVAEAVAYRDRIRAAVPADLKFEPLMTCYLTDGADPAELDARQGRGRLGRRQALSRACHDQFRARRHLDGPRRRKAWRRMEKAGMPLLVHGEVTDPDVDIFDREAVFLDKVLAPLLKRHPGLKIVLEHITTREGVAFVEAHPGRMGGTITPHHLSYNRNAIFKGGIRPHFYCLPIAKREEHRLALRRAATSGSPQFFLGTDTAPHTHRHQGMRLRLRRRLQRAGGDAGLCPGLRRGGRARQARGLRLAERPALLRPAGQRGDASPCTPRRSKRPRRVEVPGSPREWPRPSPCSAPIRRSAGRSSGRWSIVAA